MRKVKFIYGAIGLLALGLTACSNDDVLVKDDIVQKDQVRYMHVAICNPTSNLSRAEDEQFQDGTAAENEVKSMYFKFFDRKGDPIATIPYTDVKFVDESETNPDVNTNVYKEAVVKVQLIEGAGMPAYVLCFINPTNWGDIEDNTIKLEDFRTKIRQSYGTANGGFAMSNSVYYGTDKVTGATDVKISGTPITYDQLFTTEQEAADAEGGYVVDIYVERYAAKVQLILNQTQVEDVDKDGYTLSFSPEAWTVNADSPNMYVIKRYDNDDADRDNIATIREVNDLLTDWTTWNSQTNFRSYWACSPGFYAQNFPEVSDQIIDYFGGITAGDTGAGKVDLNSDGSVNPDAPNALRYYSYNQVMGIDYNGRGVGVKEWAVAADGKTKPSKYVLENTMSSIAFESKNPKASAPSILLVGKYVLTNADGTELPAGTTFYLKDDKIYFEDSDVENAVDPTTMMDYFLERNEILFTLGEDGKYTEVGLDLEEINPTLLALFEVKHPDAAVRGTAPVTHNFVTLQLTGTLSNLYYSPNGTDEYVQVTGANLNQVNSLLWNQVGQAQKYTSGMCYYSIPIKHLGWFERERTTEQINGPIIWSGETKNVLVGDVGIVRNHIYDIYIESIDQLASGISDPDDPIVTPADVDNYWIKYKLNILNWRVVNTQNVNIK